MYYKFRSNILFRNFGSYGYITDDRNYRYIKDEITGDRIVSESGAIFLSTLTKYPTHISKISAQIKSKYKDVDIKLIKNDVEEFFNELIFDGFICKGISPEECDNNDYYFSYNNSKEKVKINFNKEEIENTDEFIDSHGISHLSSVHIEITSKCNERCIHCYIPHDKKVKVLNIDHVYDILKQCKDMNVLHITLSGGEPLLHKNFCDILKKCREYDFAVSILTNLTLLNSETISEMKLNSMLGVQTSLYSMDSDIHDSITKMTGSFQKTKSSILELVDNDIPIQISCPIMKQNRGCYSNVIEWANKYGLKASEDYSLIAEYDHSNKNICNRLSLNEVHEILKDKISNNKEYTKNLKNDLINKKNVNPDDPVCSVCTSSICIAENGNVYPCAGWQDCVLGNTFEEPLIDIWNFSEKVNSLRSIKNRDFPKCMQCDAKGICSMCMVRNANEDCNGNYLNLNQHFCDISHLIKKLLN